MCIIIDDENMFIHNPKCAGTSISRMINSQNIRNSGLKNINNKLRVGHFGVYPLIQNNLYNESMTLHMVVRDPAEWYVSLYNYVKKNEDHPYNIYAKKDFKFFFENLVNMKEDKVKIDKHLEKHVNRKINNHPLFCEYKSYDKVLLDAKNRIYIQNHPDLNILLSERNISEGLYTYFILFLITKINPLHLFEKSKECIMKNIEKYLSRNVKIYDINDIDIFLKNVGFVNTGVFTNKSNIKKSYIDYYDEEMLNRLQENHKLFYMICNNFRNS